MNEYEIHLSLPDCVAASDTIPMTFFAATGLPVVGDVMKITPDRKPLVVVGRHWIAEPNVTHVYLVLEEQKPPMP